MKIPGAALLARRSEKRGDTLEIAAHADAAMRAVRLLLGALSCCVIGAYRPLTGPPSWGSLTGVLALIIATVATLNWLSGHIEETNVSRWVLQAFDVIASVGLVFALDDPLGHQSWVLLLVPVVSAAVRYGAAASVLSWAGGCIGYLTAALLGVVSSTDDLAILVRIPGSLLAVALTVGILARWMREGWEIQNELTETVARQEHRLSVIERTGRALRGQPTDEALHLCASQMLELGFSAGTIRYLNAEHDTVAVGRTDLVAQDDEGGATDSDEPTVTVWLDGDDAVRVHSVTLYEPQADVVISGWSEAAIDADLAQAFVTLVAHASTAIESTKLLEGLRHSASHDGLTGLANRRTLDQELKRTTNEAGRIAIAFVDLDHFKDINDTHGHAAGDKALIAIARRLEGVVGRRGLVSRYGGDEFVVLLPNMTFDEAKDIAKGIMKSASDPVQLGSAQVHAGLSIGLASACTPIASSAVVGGADQALYQAKEAGRGAIVAIDLDRSSQTPPQSSVEPMPLPDSGVAPSSEPVAQS